MKKLLLTLTLLCAGTVSGSFAGASPATDLFNAATSAVQDEYYGWATADFGALKSQYARTLQATCAPEGESCSYNTARAVLTRLFEAYGDAHTNVRDPDAAERLREVMEDRAVPRTGIRTVKAEGGLLVVSVMKGSPADSAGLKRFDLLTEVNGQQAGLRQGKNTDMLPNDFMKLERQAAPITVTVRRPAQAAFSAQLGSQILRARDEPSLSWLDDTHQTALIDLPSFLASGTAARFLNVVNQAQQGGARNLIIDLRFNGGGSLAECVAAASIFGPVIYQTQYQQGGYTYAAVNGHRSDLLSASFPAEARRVWQGQAAVLVGPNTASCAEVFSIYAQKRGVKIIGEETKGVGNSGVVFHDLPDGGIVAVTVLRAFGPDRQPLPQQVTPDIPVRGSVSVLTLVGRDTVLEAALNVLKGAPASAERP